MDERYDIIFDYFKDIKDKERLLDEIDTSNPEYAEELKDMTVEEILADLKNNIDRIDSDDWDEHVKETIREEYDDCDYDYANLHEFNDFCEEPDYHFGECFI